MHKLFAVEGMVETALARAEQAGSPRVVGMHFVINAGGHVSEESVQVCFTLAAHGTRAEGASLYFEWNPPHYKCFECGHEFDSTGDGDSMIPCPKCTETATVIPPAEEFYLDSIDVE